MSFIIILACKFFTWGEQCVLLLDRTNRKWGKTHINILVLSIEHLGMICSAELYLEKMNSSYGN